MSLTRDFLNNFQNFMHDHVLLVPAQVAPKDGQFKLQAQGNHAAVVENSNSQSDINGYYVHPVANNDNVYALPTQQDETYYMLTDTMNGCQFIAYGPDRQHVTVEHNNYIGNPANYALRLAAIQAQNPAYIWHISAAAADNIVGGTYDPAHGINLVGTYDQQNGWRFWVRERVDQNQGQIYGPF